MTQPSWNQPPNPSELPPPPTAPPRYGSPPSQRGSGSYQPYGGSPYGAPPSGGYAPKKKKGLPTGIIILLALAAIPVALILFAGLIFGFYYLMMETAEEFDLKESEVAMLLTAAEVHDQFLVSTPLDTEYEDMGKTVYFDKSFDINYEYSDPEDEGIYISITVNYEPKMSDAMIGYNMGATGSKAVIGLMGGDEITFDDKSTEFKWGDRSTLYFILNEGEPVGHIFTTMKGKYNYDLLATGFAYETVEEFEEVMGPKLKAFEDFINTPR